MRRFFVSFLFCSLFNLASAQSVRLPADHWGYAFLEKMQARRLFASPEFAVRPLTRQSVAEILVQIQENVQAHPSRLSAADHALLQQLLGDFADELRSMQKKHWIPGRAEKHLLTWAESTSQFYVDAYGQQTADVYLSGSADSLNELEIKLGAIARGQLGGAIGFYLDAFNALQRGSGKNRDEDMNFNPSLGLPVNITGKNVFQDNALAYLIVEKGRLCFQIGRDHVRLGPTLDRGVALSGNMPPSEVIRLQVRFGPARYNLVQAFLSSGLGDKYLNVHRFDWMPHPRLLLGGSSIVVHSARHLDGLYMLPVIGSLVNSSGERGGGDNFNLSLDAAVFLPAATKLYGEVFLDQMGGSQDRWALLLGSYLVAPMNMRNLDLRAEYLRVQPGTYAHRDSILIYTHYNKGLGAERGPNMEQISLQAGYQWGRDIRLMVSWDQVRKGEGGFYRLQPAAEKFSAAGFMQGPVKRQQAWRIQAAAQLMRDFFLSLSLMHRVNTGDWAVDYPKRENSARMTLLFNY